MTLGHGFMWQETRAMDHPGGFLPKLILMVVLASGCLCPSAYADKRVALVIGNAPYAHVAPESNPGKDARLMAVR